MKQNIMTASILLALFFSLPNTHATSVPPLINYQGTLTDATGNPIANESKKLTFNIYDTPIEGTLVWGPQIFNTVPVISGQFNVILGTTDTQGRSIVEAFEKSELFLGITVDDGAEIIPRQQILSTPYALSAYKAHATHEVKGDVWTGIWPGDTEYVFWGATAINQTGNWNYALAQNIIDGTTSLGSPTQINFTINGDQKMVIADNGMVGIGTASPQTTLDVNGDISTERGGIVSGIKWNPLPKTALGELSWTALEVVSYPIPINVPADAKEVLVYVWVWTGGYNGEKDTEYKFYTHEDDTSYARYLRVRTYSQSAYSYNSDTFWLPTTVDWTIHAVSLGETITGNKSGEIVVIGYR